MLLCFLCASLPLSAQPHLDTAKSYLFVREKTGKNDGYYVEKFLKYVGRKKGDSWCAAYVSYCLGVSKVSYPTVKSGLARSFKLKSSIKANDVLLGRITIPPGSIVIWEKGSTIFGHVGFVIKWLTKSGTTIEGNTGSGNTGSQSDGDGVYKRTRYITPGNYFRITSFTLVGYKNATNIKLNSSK